MKKIYILIIIVFGFLMFNSKVFAIESFNTSQPVIDFFDSNANKYNPPISSSVSYNTNWYCTSGSLPSSQYNRVVMRYTNLPFDGETDYDLYFNLLVNSDGYMPLVTYSQPVCHVETSSTLFAYSDVNGNDSNYINGKFVSVKCENVNINSNFNLTAFFNSDFYFNNIHYANYSASFCVSRRFSYIKSRDQLIQESATNTQAIVDEQKNTTEEVKKNTEATKEVNNTLKDSSVDNQQAEGFFNDFNDNSHGLSGIITAPLNMINNLASATCSPISINLPFVDTQFNLPCMSTIYQQNFGTLFSTYRVITFGIVAYYVCVNIFALVKGFKDPENDKVEVVEL